MTRVLCLVLSVVAGLALLGQIGTGSANAATTTSSAPATRLGAPVGLVGVAGMGQVQLNWQPPTGTISVSGYLVEMKAFDRWWKVEDVYGQTTSVVKGLVDSAGSFFFRVTAFNDEGLGAASVEVGPFTTVASSWIPGPPSGLSAAVVGSRLNLRWKAPAQTAEPPLTKIIGYAIEVQVGGNWKSAVRNTWTDIPYASLPLPLQLEESSDAGTTPGLPMQVNPTQVRVRAINQWTPILTDGVGPPSQPCATSIPQTPPPSGTPVFIGPIGIVTPGIRAKNVIAVPMAGVNRGARLTWSEERWGMSGSPVFYKIEKSATPAIPRSWTSVSVVGNSVREVSISSLDGNQFWSFRITPVSDGNGGTNLASPALSNPVYPLPNPTLPSAPPSVSVRLEKDGTATISWGPSTSTGGITTTVTVQGYIVEVQKEGSGEWRPATPVIARNITQANVRDLNSGTSYRFRVRSIGQFSSFWKNPLPALGEVSIPTPWITPGGIQIPCRISWEMLDDGSSSFRLLARVYLPRAYLGERNGCDAILDTPAGMALVDAVIVGGGSRGSSCKASSVPGKGGTVTAAIPADGSLNQPAQLLRSVVGGMKIKVHVGNGSLTQGDPGGSSSISAKSPLLSSPGGRVPLCDEITLNPPARANSWLLERLGVRLGQAGTRTSEDGGPSTGNGGGALGGNGGSGVVFLTFANAVPA